MAIQIIDKIVLPDDRKRKYTDRQIVKILIVLQIFNISYRSTRIIDLHAMNMEITSLYSIESIVAVDSVMIHTCKYSTAMRRKAWNNYKDPVSG